MSTTISAGTATSGAALSSDTSGILQLQSGSTPTTGITLSTAQSTTLNSATSTAPLIAQINGTEVARIDSSGNLLVGTASGSSKVTSYGTGSSSSPRGAIYAYTTNSGDLSYPAFSCTKTDNNQSTSQVYVQFTCNGGALGNGQINGNGSNAAAFGTYSDKRLKQNIVDLPSQLNNITALRPVEFDYIASEGGGHQIGFIAQEMQKIYPDAVSERADGMLTITGWDKTTAMLVKAIQELSAKVTALEAKVGV